MSNFLSIAVVTEAFRQVLTNAANASGIPGAIATAVRPSSGSNNGQPGSPPTVGVNLFLYQVTPNGTFRNMDTPSRRTDGSLLQPTRSAYDLHYLLTFYGSETQLEPQRVMGSVLRALHSIPVLTHKQLEGVKKSIGFLKDSNLDIETETVKLNIIPLNLEELSKLWSVFFQTTYHLSLAFQASVVIIDGTEISSPSLPVMDRNIYVRPFQQPFIEHVLSQKNPAGEALPNKPIVIGDTIILQGQHLHAEMTRIRLGELVVTPAEISDTFIKFPLATPPFSANTLRAGVHGLQIEQSIKIKASNSEYTDNESNIAAFVLHPIVTASARKISRRAMGVAGTTEITLKFSPVVDTRQRVTLLLNESDPPLSRPARAYRFDIPITSSNPAESFTNQVTHNIDVEAGTYLVRVQVDGAESLLDRGTGTDHLRFIGPKVVIS